MPTRRREPKPARQRVVVAICSAVAMLGPAGVAHADPAQPTDYATEIVGIEPATPSIDVGVIGGDSFVELTAERGTEVVVLGYWGEPYLRFNSDGTVEENRRSPTVAENESRYGGIARRRTGRCRRRVAVGAGRHRRQLRLARPPRPLDESDAAAGRAWRPGAHRGDPSRGRRRRRRGLGGGDVGAGAVAGPAGGRRHRRWLRRDDRALGAPPRRLGARRRRRGGGGHRLVAGRVRAAGDRTRRRSPGCCRRSPPPRRSSP